jgi:hypothetical protein
MAGIDLGLQRSACSYAIMASSRLPMSSATLPGEADQCCSGRSCGSGLTKLQPHRLIHRGHLLRSGPLLLRLRLLRRHDWGRRASWRSMMQLHACWRRRMMGSHRRYRHLAAGCEAGECALRAWRPDVSSMPKQEATRATRL